MTHYGIIAHNTNGTTCCPELKSANKQAETSTLGGLLSNSIPAGATGVRDGSFTERYCNMFNQFVSSGSGAVYEMLATCNMLSLHLALRFTLQYFLAIRPTEHVE